jgi:hypothetical protein
MTTTTHTRLSLPPLDRSRSFAQPVKYSPGPRARGRRSHAKDIRSYRLYHKSSHIQSHERRTIPSSSFISLVGGDEYLCVYLPCSMYVVPRHGSVPNKRSRSLSSTLQRRQKRPREFDCKYARSWHVQNWGGSTAASQSDPSSGRGLGRGMDYYYYWSS